MAEQVLEFEKPILELEARIEELQNFSTSSSVDLEEEVTRLRERLAKAQKEIFANLTPWQKVLVARHRNRPQASDYIRLMTTNSVELCGDKAFGDDKAIVCTMAEMDGRKVMIIGHRRGKHTDERIACNFGSAHPEGYRKAIQKMKLAERFNLPVVTLIDTMGAYPGIEAEERGQAQAIADSLMAMAQLRVPVVSTVIGEGGSGGAIGIGLANRLLIMENGFYSVISPEGCAAILWKDAGKSADAAQSLKLTAPDLMKLGIVDEIVEEPLGGGHRNPQKTAEILKKAIIRNLDDLSEMSAEELVQARYDKFRNIGFFEKDE